MQRIIQTIAISLTLMGLSLGCLGSNSMADNVLFGAAARPAEPACSSAVTISTKEVSLSEDGDVTAVYDEAEDNLLSESDPGGPPSWGYQSFQTCIYPNTAFSGTLEIPLSNNGNLSGRYSAQLTYRDGGAVSEALPDKLTFTGSGSSNRQCITYTVVNDTIRNTPEDPYVLDLGTMVEKDASNEDNLNGSYYGNDACDISLTIDDNEGPGIRVSNISNVMEEPGVATPNSGTFRVVLRTAPTANVTIPINETADSVNANNREGTIAPTTLTFTPANWDTDQIVTVTSVDDLEVDGIKIYTISVENTSSSDADYNGINPRDVVVYNRDQSVPGYAYEKFTACSANCTGTTTASGGTIDGFATDESNQMGTTYSTFKIKLRSKPAADVTLNFTTTCGSKCNLLTSSLTFTPSNWSTYQTVQVEGKSDSANSGLQDYFVDFTASSTDTTYSTSVTEPRFQVRSCDNDAGNLIAHCNFSGSPLGTSGSRFSKTEGGTSITWLIAQSSPGAAITVPLGTSNAATGGSPATSPITIDSSNYNKLESGAANRIVMNHASDDTVNTPANRPWTLTTGTASNGFDPIDIEAQTNDDEKWFYVKVVGNTKEDDSKTATVYVCLGANNPTQTVTVNYSCSGDECDFASNSVTFPVGSQVDIANASDNGCSSDPKAQSFVVTGAQDDFADGNQTFTVVLTKAVTTDTNYSSAPDPSNKSVTNEDDEPSAKAIYVATTSTSGEMTNDGVQGADDLCNTSKPAYAPSGTYKALIASDSSGEVNDRKVGAPDWPINSTYYYYLCTSGGNCSDEVSHAFIGSAFNPALMTKHDSNPIYWPSGTYWTGMNTGLSPQTQASTPNNVACNDSIVYRNNCHGFTYETCPTDSGVNLYGEIWSSNGSGTFTNEERACTESHNIICVQQ